MNHDATKCEDLVNLSDLEIAREADKTRRWQEVMMAKKRESKTRTNPETTVTLSESDIAMIDALGILFNIAIGGRDAAGQQVAGAFDSRIHHWTKASKPKTAAIMGLMKQLATDPTMLAGRRQRTLLRYAVPKGRA